MAMLPRTFVHDANQCLHVIRLTAEALRLEQAEGRLASERLDRRLAIILDQVDHLGLLLESGGNAAAPISAASPVEADAAAPTEDNRRAVLLVDDDAASLEVLAAHLISRGFAVTLAHDGAQALERCQAQVFDAVVTDIRMPRMDGHQLTVALETLQPGTPVIVVSAHLAQDDNLLFPSNVRCILTKPFSPSQIDEELAVLCAAIDPCTGGV